MEGCLSHRAAHTRNFPNFKRKYSPIARLNKYHETKNPTGIMDLGGAENKLCEELILERLSRSDIQEVVPASLYYPPYHGSQGLRESVADYLNEKLNAKQKLQPDNMIVTSGVGAALDMLAYAIGDPGDYVLSPSPYYTRIKTDIGERSALKTIDVPLEEVDASGKMTFPLTVEKLINAWEKATEEGKNVVGIVLISPHNPLGDVYSGQLLTDILQFAAREKLHVIMDEIYALSVFEGEFTSMVALPDLPDPARTHWVWGFSKDLAISGYRVGVIHSWNPVMINSLKPLSYFGAVPSCVQSMAETLMRDREWLDKTYLPTNLERMRASRDYVAQWLDKLGVPHNMPTAAFFFWADFSKFIDPFTMDGQTALFEKIFYKGVYIEPSQAYYTNTVGFFRIIFTLPKDYIDKAFKRIEAVLSAQ